MAAMAALVALLFACYVLSRLLSAEAAAALGIPASLAIVVGLELGRRRK